MGSSVIACYRLENFYKANKIYFYLQINNQTFSEDCFCVYLQIYYNFSWNSNFKLEMGELTSKNIKMDGAMQDKEPRGTKINRILARNPQGVPMTSSWLASQEVSPQLLQGYKNSGWLNPLGRGAWIRSGAEPTLAGSIYALQRQNSVTVYPAACTALGFQGRLHYLPLGASPVLQISVRSNKKLPLWFTRQPFAGNLRVLNADVLFKPVSAGITDWNIGEFSLKISSPERAMLEYCYLLPNYGDFEEAKHLMESLATLRPSLLQSTLHACKSVKAKRLFLALADIVAHKWYGELDLSSVELGSGSRHISINGLWNPRFKITVPEIWMDL